MVAVGGDGTRNVITPEPPWTASTPDTLTWAEAAAANSRPAARNPPLEAAMTWSRRRQREAVLSQAELNALPLVVR